MPIASSNGVRLVLDTNTVISGLLWGGTPGRLIDAAKAGRVELVSSAPLLAELQGVDTVVVRITRSVASPDGGEATWLAAAPELRPRTQIRQFTGRL